VAAAEPVADAPRARVTAPALASDSGGGLLTLCVQNTSTGPLFVTVLSLQENREVNVVWPSKNERDALLRPGQEQRIPVLVGPSASWRRGRPMVDRYLAIGTASRADFSDFTSAAAEWQQKRGSPQLPAFLDAAFAGSRTRGGGDDVWGLAWLDLELLPPK
jgi:hypothetical protein